MKTSHLLLTFFFFASLFISKSWALTLEQELKPLGILPVIQKRSAQKFSNLEFPEDRYVLDIKLGKLTQTQFNQLKARFGATSQVPYQANRIYELTDFLPPVVQALLNHTYEVTYVDVRTRNEEISFLFKGGVATASNCFNTTIETLRSLNGINPTTHRFYFPDRWKVTDYFRQNMALVKPTQARTWDALTFVGGHSGYLKAIQHTALVITDDIVFEKTDASSDDPYRLSYTKDVLKKYARVLKETFPGNHGVEYRRLASRRIPDFKQPITVELFSSPDIFSKLPADIKNKDINVGCEVSLGGGCEYTMTHVQTGTIQLDKNGRGVMTGPGVLRLFRGI